ncbi:hypothetical protein M422DRAFT_195539 [Sphaerobolus stellatus SS14]|uniref:Uncharacterized protein n=1 Tax=Sphaerobolus stellatus (strain SS14) TaxID=990650 RepID=A0A0C9U3N0_SPHS4|nr:hypothetical protein M422DRAFT_195539 [Sphaerobolus stellatus SS14]
MASEPITTARYFPFPNHSTFKLSSWYYRPGSGGRSAADFNELCRVVSDPSFQAQDIVGFNSAKRDQILDRLTYTEDEDGNEIAPLGGWRTNVNVRIQVPEGKGNWTSDQGQTFLVPGLHHKSITEIVRIWFETKENMHYTPFEMWWRATAESEPTRIYGDLSSSDAFIAEHNEINMDPKFDVPGCTLEKVVGGIMISSDSTHLAQFGNASLWPIYAFPGNIDSLFRMSPHSNSDEHWAYIPTLPPNLRDFVQQISGQSCSPPLYTHCKRELVQSIWELLLDEDFQKAYKEGIVVKCADGITRRVYLRIFTYSADYPEKMLMLSLRDQGNCVCPRCCIPRKQIGDMGMKRDMQRRETLKREDNNHATDFIIKSTRLKIYGREGLQVSAAPIEALLRPTSRIPTINTFSKIFEPEYFNKYQIFVVDLMHEFELGVWKAILVHIIRILTTMRPSPLQEFDRRFRLVATFGRDTIRKFPQKVSDLKKLAARDYEDILQCSMPVLEGLFDEPHETVIRTLLLSLSEWHALAKLRMHTESTLMELEKMTSKIGQNVRKFAAVTCSQFNTTELEREVGARRRRVSRNQPANGANSSHTVSLRGPKDKKFNYLTPKFHFLGDYCPTIRWFGTTPGYSTQMGERAHRKAKQWYPRVSKAAPALGMTRIDQRATNMRNILTNVCQADSEEGLLGNQQYHAPLHTSLSKYLMCFQDFYDLLKDHLFARLTNRATEDDELDITQAQRNMVLIRQRVLYRHQTCRINFTTYDMQRSQDSINPSTSHRDIMLHAGDDPASHGYHPYWYARVLGVFHCTARLNDSLQDWTDIPFLWIRWFGRSDHQVRGPINRQFLDQIGFVTKADNTDQFGFIDPAKVIRACHLIPAFNYGELDLLQPGSVGRNTKDGDLDYVHYYVNQYVDRDMYMRYLGGGIGHTIHYDPELEVPDIEDDPEPEEDEPLPNKNPTTGDQEVQYESEDDISVAGSSEEEPEGDWGEGYVSP